MPNQDNIQSLPNDIFLEAMPRAGLSDDQVTLTFSKLSQTNKYFYGLFKEELQDRAIKKFCQAAIDGDYAKVKRLLDANPKLLLAIPKNNIEIESKLTWQKMYAENVPVMLAKRRQLQMLKFIYPYYEKLGHTEEVEKAKTAVKFAWQNYSIKKEPGQNDMILFPIEYTIYAKSLVNVFAKETYPDGKFSQATEAALSTLFEQLFPKQAKKLDDYNDPELLLLALYSAYWTSFLHSLTWNQRDDFCIRVIGLVQTALSPEAAAYYCNGINKLNEPGRVKISEDAARFHTTNNKYYYRLSSDDKESTGFKYLCSANGKRVGDKGAFWKNGHAGGWITYMLQKEYDWQSHFQTQLKNETHQHTNSCNIS